MKNKKISNIHPMVYEKTRDGEALYDIYSRLIKDRIIFLSEEITAEVGTTIAATLLYLDSLNKDEINLYINSPGGSVADGLYTIYDMMQYIESPISTVNIGCAYSASAVLLVAGTKGKRYAFKNSSTMIHEVQLDGDFSGPASEFNEENKRIKLLNNKIMETISLHTGQKLSKVKNDCVGDLYMTAEEALAYGIIDKILEPKKIIIPKTSAKIKKK